MKYKIFDIGGSFIKIYDSITNKISRIKQFDDNIINLNNLKKIIIDNIDENIDYIGLSCQMHGFCLFNEEKQNLSNFITWKHSAQHNILTQHNLFDDFYVTGLEKRNDLPINNLYNYLLKNNINTQKIYFKNISEALLDESFDKTHSSMACGHGFFDLTKNNYLKTYINFFENKFNINLLFDNVINHKDIGGLIYLSNKKIPVYIGLGDLQASIYSFNLKHNPLIINLATGSQIISIENNFLPCKGISFRPYFDNMYLKCITHIPSGRFLNIYANFFEQMNIDFWEFINTLTLNDINSSSLSVSTDIFCDKGINILGITHNNFNLKNLISSIIKSYVNQYIILIEKFYLNYDYILLSGGIGKKIPLIRKMIEDKLKKEVIINKDDDDSLLGTIKFILE